MKKKTIQVEKIEIERIKVLDKGFVQLIHYMGNDKLIADCARVSYGKGTKTKRQDEGLINYLWKNKHTTPFEMPRLIFHIKAPIFVARQWFRHRTASYNEISARYSEVRDEFYLPNSGRLQTQCNKNKQASSGQEVANSNNLINEIEELFVKSHKSYEKLLKQGGVAREMARIVLPVSGYTEFIFGMDLKNLLHFINLRDSSDAQYEIREYAKVILLIVNELFPMAIKAFKDNK
jgi:thymidylate synthase (FAD)